MRMSPPNRRKWLTCLALLYASSLAFPVGAQAGDLFAKARGKVNNHKGVATAESLAVEIDRLEKHIDWYGTIVAKQPDVWGQARLMKHRREFEQQLFKQLGKFESTIQASLSRSDQAFLASAFSLSAAISGAPAVELPQTAATSREIVSRQRAALKAQGVKDPKPEQLMPTLKPIAIPDKNPSADLVDDFDVIERSASITSSRGIGIGDGKTLGLEPTVHLNQLAHYINHLHEIRRINEGDDTVSSPGYALHLVRIPVSILPGSKTRKGYGAEITFTATPYLGRDLLPSTFRNLVVNDVTDQIAAPIGDFFNSPKSLKDFSTVKDAIRVSRERTSKTAAMSASRGRLDDSTHSSTLPVRDHGLLRASQDPPLDVQREFLKELRKTNKPLFDASAYSTLTADELDGRKELPPGLKNPQEAMKLGSASGLTVSTTVVPSSNRSRNSRFAFPGTQMLNVYGSELILPVIYQAYDDLVQRAVDDEHSPRYFAHHTIESYVQDQVTAAYDFMSRPENEYLWINYATSDLAHAIQKGDALGIKNVRCQFLAALGQAGINHASPYADDFHTLTAAFSWAVLVEGLLLNERLITDIKESASAKGLAVAEVGHHQFFLPNPSDEARDAFNQYIKIRFPIHVFAVDPPAADQNISDDFARSRELQLALSLAFVSGNISASNMTRFARRLEWQAQTIALNRTQVGFSHGEDTFGWRFQPRYQTPPIQNNIAAIRQTIIGGPTREEDRRQLELEVGPRECVAIVIMPSFVPYVTFDSRSNWYRLNSPKHSEIDAVKFLELSASIKKAYALAQSLCDSGTYRDGDVGRLVARVNQLSAELPFQTMIQQVPHENTHGGFELFNVGVTDLAPELRSWYGAPGISLDNGTSLYLVGDNYSVHETSVIVGNKHLDPINDFALLSRQVMRVNIPPGTQPVMRSGSKFVEVSIATPYGVSQSLYVPVHPVVEKKAEAASVASAPSFNWSPTVMELAFVYDGTGIAKPGSGVTNPRKPTRRLMVAIDSGVDLTPTTADLRLVFDKPYDKLLPIDLKDVPFSSVSGAFEISGALYDGLVDTVFARFAQTFNQTNPPKDLPLARTILRLKGSNGPVVPIDVSSTLTIKWANVTPQPH